MTRIAGLIALVACLLVSTQLRAQDRTLELGSQIDAELAAGETHAYVLSARELTLASFRVEALDDSLDPRLTIVDRAGETLISNDDYDYPASRDAMIQALVLPRAGQYELQVSGFGGGAGRYRLQAMPGFDQLAEYSDKLAPANWEQAVGAAVIDQGDSQGLAIQLEGMARLSLLPGRAFPAQRDYYFEVAFERVAGAAGWHVGLLFRYVDADNHARLLLNKRGFWRVERVAEGQMTVLRDWQTHPAIVPGESDFRLGLLASGRHLDIVYQGQAVGRANDTVAEAGAVGIALRTADAIGGRLNLLARSALMTTPIQGDAGAIKPARLAATRQAALIAALARHQLIPVGGEIRLTIPRSTVRHPSAGVTPYLLGSSLEFGRFVVGARLSYNLLAEANGGCGILFHYADDEHYQLAYVTAAGDMGLSRRVGSGFAPGIYTQRESDQAARSHDLLLIAAKDSLRFYVDGLLVGEMPAEESTGKLGIAVVNYEPVDTNCVYEDFWALSLDA